MNPPATPTPLRRFFSAKTLVHLVFWSWHAVWVLAVWFGLAPKLLPELLSATFAGEIPWGITGCALGLLALPCLTLVAGWRLRDDHRKLFGLFYGVAGVGFTLLAVRLFFIREMTGGVALMLVTLAAGAAFYTAELFGRVPTRTRGAAIAAMIGYTALLVVGLWVAIVMGLFCIPAIALLVQGIPELVGEILQALGEPETWVHMPVIIPMVGLMACSALVVFGLPFALAVLYPRAWWRNVAAWGRQRSFVAGIAFTTALVGGWITAFVLSSQQPQGAVFDRLAVPPADRVEQADDVAHTEEIRAGLLNAALAPYRYWGGEGDEHELASMYRAAFHTDADVTAPQWLFNRLAAPLVYDGDSVHADRRRAELAYERFFDRPLQDGDREAVTKAISATYDRTQAEAGLLDVGNRTVLLVEQELTRSIEGDVASFELHEVYENQTVDAQEVFYYFNLPERAAITGLWLGDGPDRERRFTYTVAPRGAAQAVYRQQREQRVDPALIEQVGPRQYRLRVFPIAARTRDGDALRMHMWLQWSVLAEDGGWPMPRLAEARNVYWDEEDTTRTIDGAPADHEGWLPARIEGTAEPRTHELVLHGHRVRATPATATGEVEGKLAVVVDTSLSMREHAQEVRTELALLESRGLDFDVYVAPSPWSCEQPHRVAPGQLDPFYYGGHTHEGVLADFASVRGDEAYAAVIVLSDPGSFAFLQDDSRPIVELDPAAFVEPIWMVHLGGLPFAYRDQLVELIRASGGGVATGVDEALARIGSSVVDGYRWELEPAAEDDGEDEAFAPIAAAALVGHLGDRGADLDAIHRVAVEHAVVTPWSSMIVLVDDAQRRALERASQAKDRFEREAESGVESTTTPDNLEVTATPEPHEWMLLGLAALALLAVSRMRVRAATSLA